MRYLVILLVFTSVVGCASNQKLTEIDAKYSQTVSSDNFSPEMSKQLARTVVIGDSTVVVSNGGNR